MTTADRLYVIVDPLGHMLDIVASPNSRSTTRSVRFAKTFASATAARDWLAALDAASARRPSGCYQVEGLPAAFFGELAGVVIG